MSCSISGLLVTIPVPRGRLGRVSIPGANGVHGESYKSLPTMFSSTELFPLDCEPTTAI